MRLSSTLIPFVIWSASASAIAAPAKAPSVAAASPMRCLARPYVGADGAKPTLSIAVPADQVANFAAGGFAQIDCAQVQVEAYRSRICRLALQGGEAVQAQLEKELGAAPAALCAAVKQVAPFPSDDGLGQP